jgi:sulfite oxidase
VKLPRRSVLAAAPALALARSGWADAPRQLEVLGDRPAQLQTPLEYFDRLLTPNDVFFVRSHHGMPRLDLTRKLEVTGLVESPLSLSLAELQKLPQTTVTAVLQCAGNGRALFSPTIAGAQWTHGAMGQAEWTGVRLAELLARAKPKGEAKHVWLIGADLAPRPATPAFHRDLPLQRALAEDTLVAWQMNGEPLPLSHGAPFRLVVPGWAGSYWLKWLTRLELAATEHSGFFVAKGYRTPNAPVAPGAKVPPEQMVPVTVMPVKSIIARPLEGAVLPPGKQEVVGVAFSGLAALKQVEVSLDEQTWVKAKLEGKSGLGRWQVFRATVEVKAETTPRVVARATDAKGNVQPRELAWNPSGYHYNAWHAVRWSVT